MAAYSYLEPCVVNDWTSTRCIGLVIVFPFRGPIVMPLTSIGKVSIPVPSE
jgi:hypothetical protein